MVMHEYATGLQAHYRWNRYENNGEAEWRVTEHWLQEHDRERLEEYLFDYDLSERTLQVKQSGVGVTFRRWNSQHQITEFIDEMNGKWLFEWNDARQLLSATDPQQGIYRFLYDERGNLSCERIPPDSKLSPNGIRILLFPFHGNSRTGPCGDGCITKKAMWSN